MAHRSPWTNLSFLIAKWAAKGAALGVWGQLLGITISTKLSTGLGLASWLGNSHVHAAVGGAAIFGWLGLAVACFLIAAGCRRWDDTAQNALRSHYDLITIAFDWAILIILFPCVVAFGRGPILSTICWLFMILSILIFFALSVFTPLEKIRAAQINQTPLVFLGYGLVELLIGLAVCIIWLSVTASLFHVDTVAWIMWPIGLIMFFFAIAYLAGFASDFSLETTIIGVFLLPLRGIFFLTQQVVVVATQAPNPIVAFFVFCVGVFFVVSVIIALVDFVIRAAAPVNSIIAIAVPLIVLVCATDLILAKLTNSNTTKIRKERPEHIIRHEAGLARFIALFLAIAWFIPLPFMYFWTQRLPNGFIH